MNKFNLLTGAAVMVTIMGSAAAAQAADTGWYVGADVGMHYPKDMEINYTAIPGFPVQSTITYGAGDDFTFDGRVGYRYAPNFRIEAEGVLSPGDAGPYALRTWQLFGNLYWDVAPDAIVAPFFGAGLGIQRTNVSAPNPPAGVDDSDFGFAGQVIAGLTWKASDTVDVDLTGFYRRSSTLDWQTQALGAASWKPEEYGMTLGFRMAVGGSAPAPAKK